MATLIMNSAVLEEYVGKNIEEICPLGFGKKGDSDNHCAHFVSHVLRLNESLGFGLTCAGMVHVGKKNRSAGGCIRVNNIFNNCEDLDGPCETGCLVYYTIPGNMSNGLMGSMSKKHVGIYYNNFVYNYGNTKDAVRKDTDTALTQLYGKTTITRYTSFPTGAQLTAFGELAKLAGG